jgi:site-specific DNA-methyltransferase (adenine-specific)
MMIPLEKVKRSSHQRRLRAWKVSYLAQKMRAQGYNMSYPITLDEEGYLVDGGHRVEAADKAGLTEVPYLIKPSDVDAIPHSIRCNEDGADTERHDVFDYAELCAQLSDTIKDDDIATLLGWNTRQTVIYHRNIKTLLHPLAWGRAVGVTTNMNVVTDSEVDVVTSTVTKVTQLWNERQFRTFLSHLPCPEGDRAAMRAQVRAITALLAKPDKLTAKTAGAEAEKQAWHTTLLRQMSMPTLVQEVPLSDRKLLMTSVRQNVYGTEASERNTERFADALAALNERALGVKLYQADALEWLPTQPDGSIALVVTDPPYNTTDHAWDAKGNREEYLAWMQMWLQSLRPKLTAEYHLFVFCDPDYGADVEMLLRANAWPLKSRLIWEYRNLVKGRDVTDKFIENYQICFHCGTHALNWGPEWDKRRFMVQEFATPQSNFEEGRHHPTAKPVGLIEHLVQVGSKTGDIVLDCFAGGGTTGLACAKVQQRRCLLVEADDAFCSVIETRLGIKRVTV